jgi:hypothetical protein
VQSVFQTPQLRGLQMSQRIHQESHVRAGRFQKHALAVRGDIQPHDALVFLVADAANELTLNERIDQIAGRCLTGRHALWQIVHAHASRLRDLRQRPQLRTEDAGDTTHLGVVAARGADNCSELLQGAELKLSTGVRRDPITRSRCRTARAAYGRRN